MKHTLIVLVIVISLFSNCKKDKLPKATQSGNNTFGCKIDGALFKPSERGGLFGSPPVTVDNLRLNGFTLQAKYYGDGADTKRRSVTIYLEYLRGTGTFTLNGGPNIGVYEFDYAGGPPRYATDAAHTGSVTITRCDTVNRIYSGTFFFTAIDKNTGKVVKVTDGRFDVKQS